MADSEPQQKRHCCLSHEFATAARENPDKIAVIHASGGSLLSSELRETVAAASDSTAGTDQFYDERARSLSPPVCHMDQCFTYTDVSLAVDCLSSRLCSVLDGGDDPGVIKPSGTTYHVGKQAVYTFIPGAEQLIQSGDVYIPKTIGIYMPASVEYIVSVLSVLRCGQAFLPIDTTWPKERILSILSSSHVELVIVSRSSFGKSHGQQTDWIVESGSCPVVFLSMEESTKAVIRSADLTWPCQCSKRRLFCYLMYTSGSSGKPKGVCGTEEGLLNRLLWMERSYPLLGKELLLFKTSISFVDHLQEFLPSIIYGCTLVVPPVHKLKQNVLAIVDFLEAYRISRLTAVPSLMEIIIPKLQNRRNSVVPLSLELLVLSGEVFHILLWKKITNLFPKTTILNLYGSTEVSGDCTYFDCQKLPSILETEKISSVPIGLPISNCDVVLINEDNECGTGEIYVGGACISCGCLSESSVVSLNYVELPCYSTFQFPGVQHDKQIFIRTGDFGKQLLSGDLVFLGRKDRMIKINGQRVALVEIENTLREHIAVHDAAVVSHKGLLEAFLLLKEEKSVEMSRSIRHWMVEKLPLAMVPHHFVFLESFPRTSSGKVDYESLSASTAMHSEDETDIEICQMLEVIKKAFCDALLIEEVHDDDDFFSLGGNSIAAAHASHKLRISMKLLYDFPSPSKLQTALLERQSPSRLDLSTSTDSELNSETSKRNNSQVDHSEASQFINSGRERRLIKTSSVSYEKRELTVKRLKLSPKLHLKPGALWTSVPLQGLCSFSRCNRVMYEGEKIIKGTDKISWQLDITRKTEVTVHELWKVPMESCVDASPLVVVREQEIYIFLGSHSCKFICVDAKSGNLHWDIRLDGRIECSAAVTSDFSQVVVGCYEGKIYFLDFSNGNICWTFQTGGEVKSQPVLDASRKLIWCGSHDRNLYALDYKNHRCLFKIMCGGSIFGSPAIDEVHNTLYVGSTSGRITALSIKAEPFHVLWLCELELPVFGSLCVCPSSGQVICCLVDGSVVALDTSGSIIWKRRTDGPIFAGATIASVLPSQVLVCSRSGSVLSLDAENGENLWEYNVGAPIVASAYLDEHLELSSDRLVCICTCSGTILVLRLNMHVTRGWKQDEGPVQEFAKMDLKGEIFSSPVMIGGVIFIGCRDDHLHCLVVGTQSSSDPD